MNNIITEAIEKLKGRIEEMFEKQEVSIKAAEEYLKESVHGTICELLGAYYEACDQAIYADKKTRKAEGLTVVRHHDKRHVETAFGGIDFERTYYRKADKQYCYPADELAGISSYMRISDSSARKMVEAAVHMPYGKANTYAMNGRFTAQTVMNKVRLAKPKEETVSETKRRVACLHVDADEDHVNLRCGGNAIVPLVSVYEGVTHNGKRGSCIQVRHYSGYGMKPDDIWEKVLTRIEDRYELENTTIYLHGDGASWIRSGLEWLPRSRFVLDRYHYNKALKSAVAGLTGNTRGQYTSAMKRALQAGDRQAFEEICTRLQNENPKRSQATEHSLTYLRNNIDGIAIYASDPEASNGGCTEPHVSTILSARLSARPAAWSPKTLSIMSQLRTGAPFEVARTQKNISPSLTNTVIATHAKAAIRAALGAPDPAHSISLPILSAHSSPLVDTLRSISILR